MFTEAYLRVSYIASGVINKPCGKKVNPTAFVHMDMLTRKYAIAQLSQNLIQFLTITDLT